MLYHFVHILYIQIPMSMLLIRVFGSCHSPESVKRYSPELVSDFPTSLDKYLWLYLFIDSCMGWLLRNTSTYEYVYLFSEEKENNNDQITALNSRPFTINSFSVKSWRKNDFEYIPEQHIEIYTLYITFVSLNECFAFWVRFWNE